MKNTKQIEKASDKEILDMFDDMTKEADRIARRTIDPMELKMRKLAQKYQNDYGRYSMEVGKLWKKEFSK